MNSKEEILIDLIESDNIVAIKEFLLKHPELEDAFNDYSTIIHGFNGLRIDYISKSFSEPQKVFNDTFEKGIQAIQIDQLTKELKNHSSQSNKKLKSDSRIINLNRRTMAIAASFLILITAGMWFLNIDSESALLEKYSYEGIAMNVRGDNDSDLINNLFASNHAETWDNSILIYESENKTYSPISNFYYAYALMRTKDYQQAITQFDSIIKLDIVQWSEMAEYNKMICQFALKDSSYNSTLNEIKSDKNHLMYSKSILFEAEYLD